MITDIVMDVMIYMFFFVLILLCCYGSTDEMIFCFFLNRGCCFLDSTDFADVVEFATFVALFAKY